MMMAEYERARTQSHIYFFTCARDVHKDPININRSKLHFRIVHAWRKPLGSKVE